MGEPDSGSAAASNLADLVRRSAARAGGRTAVVGADRRLTWAELDQQVDRAANALRGLGLAEGDRVVLQLGNTVDFVVAYFGTLRAGLVALPANTGYTLPELSHLLADSGATVLLTSTVATIDGRAELGGVRIVVPGRIAPEGAAAFDELLAAAAADRVESTRGGEDTALLIYTSGTSGRPKGAMLSHRALLANLDQCGQLADAPVRPDDVVLLVLPLFHIYGLGPGLGMVAWAGATGVLLERFDASGSLDLMAAEGVTNVVGAPAMYAAWGARPEADVQRGFAKVRLAISGASPLHDRAYQRMFEADIAVHEGYGLTETAPVLTSTLVRGTSRPGSVGWPVPGVEIRLRDVDGDIIDVDEDDDPGEIVVRGANLFSGYWPDGRDGPDDEGWWATGDIAYADDDGALHLVDRSKDLILVSGFNVYPAEVEAVLGKHPDVAESAVVGVPDEETGEAVKAYLVPREGTSLTEADVLDFAGASLAKFKLPVRIEFVDRLPHSPTGKVKKGELRRRG